jgi:hypothetical protein
LQDVEIWVSDQVLSVADFSGWAENEMFPAVTFIDPQGHLFMSPPSGATTAPGGSSTASPPERSFIYLDVGRWGGGKFFSTQRDFGIVCGRTAALCGFRTTAGTAVGAGPALVNDQNRSAPQGELDAINALLSHLATAPTMGAPHVRRWDVSRAVLPSGATPTDNIVHIIFGDMHLPIIDDPTSSTFGPTMGRRQGPRVFGIDPSPQDDQDPTHLMNEWHALQWFQTYTGTQGAAVRSSQGADIFENAGPDLAEMVTLLASFTPPTGVTLHMMQLGDLIDLWIGLDLFFVEVPHDLPADPQQPRGAVVPDPNPNRLTKPADFVDFWTKRAIDNTQHANAVRSFLGFSGSKTFLYGNHDCYYAIKPNPARLKTASGGADRSASFDGGQLFAEHGHRWDDSNCDGAISGQNITQLAFAAPSVRSIEPGARFSSLIGASKLFMSRETANPILVYAMGHTHVPLLTRMVVRPRT